MMKTAMQAEKMEIKVCEEGSHVQRHRGMESHSVFRG